LLQITYHDKATHTEIEEEHTIEKILKVITTLCTKVDSMDNEIQKLKTNEDNLKSKDSQQHDYKNAELRRSKDEKNPELKGDDGKLLKTHNVCLNTVAVPLVPDQEVSNAEFCNANSAFGSGMTNENNQQVPVPTNRNGGSVAARV
ncbi:hypothetical protein MTR67_052089, partial [Solanum verrucosum]